ncbi:hypothetical protein SME10J_31870 [Serratia marcescens]|nr:hypothetical protein SME10J_31870 [Serratia marcescens]
MHVYAFGSLCRGEMSKDSDIDLLALVNDKDDRFDSDIYSIYSYERLDELWKEGNPFAWHLFLESKLIYSDDRSDYLRGMGCPAIYRNYKDDFYKFSSLLYTSFEELINGTKSYVFEMSNIFLAIRNLSICFSLAFLGDPVFSRGAALMIGDKSISIPMDVYSILEKARIMSTRGIGEHISKNEVQEVIKTSKIIHEWVISMESVNE